jgi:hypothetical protein
MEKTFIIKFIIVTLLSCLRHTGQAQTLPLTNDKLFYSQAHGETPPPGPMTDIAKQLQLEIVTNAQPITELVLRSYKLVYLRAPSKEFATEEKEALIAFVRAGGSLLLVLDEEERQSLAKTGVNDIIAPFGLRLTHDTPYLHNCGALAKKGIINKADRELPFSGGRAVEGGTPFAWQLDKDGKTAQPFAAFKKVKKGGRIIVLAEGMASMFLGKSEGQRLTGVVRDATKTTYWGKDSKIFMEEIISFLIK